MTTDSKLIARLMFQVRLYKSDGQLFENLFIEVMQLADSGFRPVKPHGNVGDRKNDGFNKELGEYYQVYAPEKLEEKITAAVKKCKVDFRGLKSYWDKISQIRKFYFTLNDKYKGAYPEIEEVLALIEGENQGISCNPFLAKDLEDRFINLSEDKLVSVVGHIPNASDIGQIDYSALKDVVDYLLRNQKPYASSESLTAPEFIEKIKFNNLNEQIANLLTTANYQVSVLKDYFQKNSTFVGQSLRDVFQELYSKGKELIPDSDSKNNELFFYILNEACPEQNKQIQDAVLVLMSYYFENCDIYEEPN